MSAMVIRDAVPDDVLSIVDLGRRVVTGADGELMRWGTMHVDLADMIERNGVHCIVAGPVGDVSAAIVGASALVPWRHRTPIACVVLWWSKNAFAGLRVLREFQRRSRDDGADLMLSAARDDRTAALYSRLGMRQAETNFLGGL